MAALEVLPDSRDWEQVASTPFRTVDATSPPLSPHYNLDQSFEDLEEQEPMPGNILPNDHNQSGDTNAVSGDDRIIIDLTQDSQENFVDETKEYHERAQRSYRLPLADITHDVVSSASVVLATYEKPIVSLPSTHLFQGPIFEDACEVKLTSARSDDLTAALDISNLADESTKEPFDNFSDRLNAPLRVGTAGNAILVQATPHLVNASNKTPLRNQLTCRERKCIIVSSIRRPPHIKKAMQLWLEATNRLLDPFREDNECWFHPAPPPPRMTSIGTLRPYGKIRKSFYWQDLNGKHSIVLNFGIVSKILFHTISKLQKDGFINKKWHLSHLCGNWTCLNPNHTTVEPGNDNISRNNCFSHRGGCLHNPNCMKEKKVNLGANGIPIYQDTGMVQDINNAVEKEIEDWSMQNFDDDDDDDFIGHEELPVN
ncbi:hypothetical protein SBOR_5116 [Sclerotinia borealis F-4128]|uniref:Zinc-binding loop region of homing endonuclease domain-containing protein n=1 Tax=Sclerotinia borealis (strain F-4128) TaxID=1432307 RepID=W9CF25_SCLBF|nr:hypothetical protein SBOR_5116 [Sclerotinia borealis F-4128]